MNALRSLMMGILMLVAFSAMPVNAQAEAIDPGLVGLWRMDGDWSDSSPLGNNATPYGSVSLSAFAKVGTQSGDFNGTTAYARIPNADNLSPQVQGKMTISGWVYLRSYPSGGQGRAPIIAKGTPGNYEYALYIYNNKSAGFSLWSLDGSTGYIEFIGGNVPLNVWTHISAVYDIDGAKKSILYINGAEVAYAGSSYGNIGHGSSPVDIAHRPDNAQGQYLNAVIDEVALYNRALSATEIQDYYLKYAVVSPTVNPVQSPIATPTITLSGTKPANTAIAVNGNILVPLDGTTTWQTTYALSQGDNNLAITALDGRNFNSLPVTLKVILDNTPPVAPSIDPVTTPINIASKIFTGIKSSDSATVVVGCAGAAIGTVSYPTATSWSVYVSGLRDGSNIITAYALDALGNQSAKTAATITVDTTPPSVSATLAGGTYKSGQSVALAANEQSVIYYTLDGSTPTVNSARYSQPISITTSATLKYLAKDLAGNVSEIKAENYVIDTIPPVLAISTLSDGAYTNNDTLNIAGTVTDNSGVTGITVNGTAVQVNPDGSFSQALLLKTGVNSITVAATDSAGNMAADTRIVTLDQTSPVLTVTTPSDNSKTGKMLLEVNGLVDKTSSVTIKIRDNVQSALMYGGAFAGTIMLEPGYNTLEITAVDLAGNRTSLKRTVVFDDQVPSLAVIAPNQDIRTNQSTLIIKGTVFDALSAVRVTISKDDELLTPPIIDGAFEQVVTFAAEKTYNIVVTATNEAGTSASVQRNVIYDITPPTLSIDQFTSPVRQSSIPVTGTREPGTDVSVSCTTATVGEVLYPTATTWQAAVSGLSAGANVITAASADAAGNAITATATVVLVTKPPEITITATPDVIWSPNRAMVPVTISGGVKSNGSDIKSVSISVSDEYGKYQYKSLTFGSTIMLEAWRNGNDRDGRKYTITVVVTAKGGTTSTKTATVTVPHSQQSISGSGDARSQVTRSQSASRPSKGAVRTFRRVWR